MKKVVLLSMLILLFWGCNQQEKRENVVLKEQLSQLQKQTMQKDSTINVFMGMLNDIESNIALIMQKEQIIAKNAALGNEIQGDVRDRIEEDIATINELMEKNKKSIAYLNKQLKTANFRITEFEERLQNANSMIEAKNVEIEELKERLAQLDFSVEVLNATIDTLSTEKIQLQDELTKHKEILDMAWFALGTKEELILNGVVEKTGGFLGMGKGYKIKPDLNREYFTAISISQTQHIPLFAKSAELVTSHPHDSYRFIRKEGGLIESIEIVDAALFWEAGKYLVIQMKQ